MEWVFHLPVLVVILLSASHGTGGVMNCIEARHQCLNEKQCGDVLSLLNKICGPELVACATTTPTKCKMLLRTLGTFDYLTNCICSEPHLDFTCHSFREIIFNHPCTRVETSEFSLTLMPNCNDAYGKCNDKASCVRDYLEFVKACTFNDITCTAQESEKCYDSWSKIRHSPVFGCVCSPPPTSHMRAMAYGPQLGSRDSLPGYKSLRNSVSDKQQMCMATYNSTHENPCLAGQQDLSRAGQVELSQATCHMSLEKCQADPECRPQLEGMMVWCEHSHCEPDRCRMALQEFYDRVSLIHRLRVAFCVCRQSDPDGECLTAMRKLHPTCAERHSGRDPLKCHKIEDQCRTSPSCSKKLEEYEQKCAADSMTGRCADTHRSCQMAVMNILGTELHATCVCKGTDFLHQHDCYTWQKLLWSNPCVIESHLMLHKEIAEEGSEGLDEVFRRPTIRTTPAARIAYVDPTPDEDEGLTFARPPGGGYGTLIQYPDGNVPRPSGTYGHEHIRPWDNNRRTGGVFIGRNNERNGGSSRGRDNNQGLGRGSSNRGLSVGRDRDRSGQSVGGYDISKGLDSSGGTRDRNRGGSVDRGYVYPEIISPGSEYPERSKGSSGRNPEGGLSVAGNGGRNGGGRNGPGGRGSGRRYEGSRRVPTLNGNRNVGGRGTDYSIDQTESGGYGSHGRGSLGPGHRGTKIKFGPQEGGSGSMPSGRDWNNIGGGRRPGRPGGSWAEYPDKGGAGGLPHFPVTRPPHRRPLPGSEYEPMPPPAEGGITPTPPSLPVPTTQSTTTTPIPTTTIPRKTCTIKNAKDEQMANLQIAEGEKKRIYNTSDCSALCECRPPSRGAEPEAMCVTLRCIDNTSCNTESAKFPHSAPFYLAYRGVCDCYAGKFICQKPDPKDYNLGPGVYMFLGYSKGEMEILKPFTSKNELDALTQMEEVLVNKYNFSCTLDLKHHIGENVIAISQLRIASGAYLNDYTKQQREKRECARPLQQLAEKINVRPRDVDILMDAHLSMFILAEVEVNFPEAQTSYSSASDHLRPAMTMTYLVSLLTLLFLHHHRHYLLLHHHRRRRHHHLQLQLHERMVPLGVRAT